MWEERRYLKLYPSVQLWELRSHNSSPSESCAKLPIVNLAEETKMVAKEFFFEAYKQAIDGNCSIHINGNILLYDYIVPSGKAETSIPKVLEFIAELQIGRKGMEAKEEFYLELEEIDECMDQDRDLGGEDHREALNEEALQNIALDD